LLPSFNMKLASDQTIIDAEAQNRRRGKRAPCRKSKTEYLYPNKLFINEKEVEVSDMTKAEDEGIRKSKNFLKAVTALAFAMIVVTVALYIHKSSVIDQSSDIGNNLSKDDGDLEAPDPGSITFTGDSSDVDDVREREETPVPTNSPTIFDPQDENDDGALYDGQQTFVPSSFATESYLETEALAPGESLSRGEFISSPSRIYDIGMLNNGNFILRDSLTQEAIWSAGTFGGYKCYMQSDGNLIVRDEFQKKLWSSNTSKHPDSFFIVDDGGRIGVVHGSAFIWTHGIPRSEYTGPSSPDLTFPVRGAFYYAWYAETWKVSGQTTLYEPDLGYYSSGDPIVAKNHIDAFEYGNIALGIVSWWGQSTNQDRSRITLLMDKTLEKKSNVKWTIYYEDEMNEDPSVIEIKADLAYLKKWFAWHPAYAHVNGKPVIFLYNNSGCDQVKRWMEAANGEWFVVAKVFGAFQDCPIQPSSWHQYGPARAVLQYEGHSFSISPGFHKADETEARLPRLSKAEWCQNVQTMIDSNEPWQLITTFNAAGEGTLIEASSTNWPSDSGYGYYLDCLHDII
jgi:hypothetical protein